MPWLAMRQVRCRPRKLIRSLLRGVVNVDECFAGDREEVALNRIAVRPGGVRTLDAKEIGAKGTPGNGVVGIRIPDEAGRRRGRGRVPREKRSEIGRSEDAREITGGGNGDAALVVGN